MPDPVTMTVQTSFPGVYVQEVPSGVRTIVGVSTSVTAFVGQTRFGPVNTPIPIGSMPEYVRTFGLPWDEARPAGHAVQLFFANGGSQALVVRVVGTGSTAATAALSQTGVTPAVNQIRWGPALFDPTVAAGHRERGVVLEGYSPFRSTDLADPVLARVAAAHGAEPAQVVLRWHVQRGFVVIPKSADPGRMRANFTLDFTLTDNELAAVDGLGG